MTEKRYHTIVVGGGIAGLTCGAYLARQGRSVLIIEKNAECGGLTSSFTREGFRFEGGIRALENAGIILPMLQELGITLEVVKSPVSVGIEDQILNIEDIGSLTDYRNLLVKFYPESEAEIDHLMKIIREVMKNMDVLYGIENPNFKEMFTDRDYLFHELLPWLPRFLMTIGKINRMNMPVEPFLQKIISNRSLLDIISQHFFKNTPAFFALSYFSLYLDYFYPVGGVGRLAASVEEKFLELGGEIKHQTTIQKVSAGENVVIDQDNAAYGYENLVWAADLKTFYRITDLQGFPQKIQSEFEKTKGRLLVRRGGDSVYTLYVMVDEPWQSFKAIANGHFFYSPSRQGLGETHWSELNNILESNGVADQALMLKWLDKFLSLNTFEISIPALKDPTLVPEGKTGLIISILAEYDLFKGIADAGWYREFVGAMEERIIRILSESVYPMLKDKVTGCFSITPLSYRDRVASSEGAITGWSFQEPVPVVNKIQAANRAVVTPIPNIFQAGQWTYSPAGVPMSILTGKLAANRVLKSGK